MRSAALVFALLLLAGCPSGSGGPAAGYDLAGPVRTWVRKADADWADAADAEVIRMGRMTAEKVLELPATKAEGVCRVLAHLDKPGARALLLEMLDHPDSRSGFYRPFVLGAATISWTRAHRLRKVDSIAPLEKRFVHDAETMTDYRWFGMLADAVESAGSRASLPALVAAAERLGEASAQALSICRGRVIKAYDRLSDPGAVPLARQILEGPLVFESGDALLYLSRHDPGAALPFATKFVLGNGPQTAALEVIYSQGGPKTEELRAAAAKIRSELPPEKRRFLDWCKEPPSWEPPAEAQREPEVARFLTENGMGNRLKYLRLWIQPELSRTRARWFAEEGSVLAQLAAVQALYAAELPSVFDDMGVADPYGEFDRRLKAWFESTGHRLTWDPARRLYAR